MKFEILCADPPWAYAVRRNTNTRFGGGAMRHYPVMSLDEIVSLHTFVKSISATDAMLFLWTTGPKMEDALFVMQEWGFDYVTVAFTWIKTNKDGKPFAGPGNYTASNAEFVLLGRNGRARQPARKLVPSVVLAPRTRHSEKPRGVIDRISDMYPSEAKIELFARSNIGNGWDVWGNEVQSGLDSTNFVI